ncbi:MAG: cobalt ECF transporter T component CbiQ [Armatimonadia bacterium]|nr:cobalt ECF transporter T component CbiQ [Armatimonadia bacterium]
MMADGDAGRKKAEANRCRRGRLRARTKPRGSVHRAGRGHTDRVSCARWGQARVDPASDVPARAGLFNARVAAHCCRGGAADTRSVVRADGDAADPALPARDGCGACRDGDACEPAAPAAEGPRASDGHSCAVERARGAGADGGPDGGRAAGGHAGGPAGDDAAARDLRDSGNRDGAAGPDPADRGGAGGRGRGGASTPRRTEELTMLTHSFLDDRADIQSPVHRLDARVKLVSAAALIAGVLVVPVAQTRLLWVYAVALVGLSLASRLPGGWILKRMAILAPFLGLGTIAVMLLPPTEAADAWQLGGLELSSQAVSVWLSVGGKCLLSLLAAVLLAGTTASTELVRATDALHVPRTITSLTGLAITYMQVLADEAGRMVTAMRSRGTVRSPVRKLRAASSMLVTLMARTVERADRIALAMVSRGYRGRMPALSQETVPPAQWAVAVAAVALAGTLTWVGVGP